MVELPLSKGDQSACADIASPSGFLARIDREAGCVRAACVALDRESAARLEAALDRRRRAAIGWAERRYRRLPAAMRARLGGFRRAALMSETGCAECRGLAATPARPLRLCALAVRGGATGVGDPGAAARLRLRPRPFFWATPGVGGLALDLVAVEPEAAPCACS